MSFESPNRLPIAESESKEESIAENTEVSVDSILEEFPEELQERLESEIEELNDADAIDYLVDKLTSRKEAIKDSYSNIEGITVLKEAPAVLSEMIEESQLSGDFLGEGQNGKVTSSNRSPGICFKVLFSDRARELHLNIFKEAGFQYQIHKLLSDKTDCARAPEILSVVNDGKVQSIMMEKIDGVSLRDVLDRNDLALLPEGFDIGHFFEKLQNSLDIMHEYGYFHCDLTNKPGNVLIDSQGQPWIIDFGSCVKSADPERPTNSYRLTVGGTSFLEKDNYGIALLKERLSAFINKQGESYE